MGRVKEEALKLIDGLPEEISWEDIIYQMYVRKKLNGELKPPRKAASPLTTRLRINSFPNETDLDRSLRRRPPFD